MSESKPSAVMRELGIVQDGDPILSRPNRPFDLPAENDAATVIIDRLLTTIQKVSRTHPFAKGMGVAAPQIGINRRIAMVRPRTSDEPILLLNPLIVARSDDEDEQYEGCLSFFDVRGLVPRPLQIIVETATLTGDTSTGEYRDGMARLILHEVDHLDGVLYTSRMRTGVVPIPVEEYRQTGAAWTYGQQPGASRIGDL